MKVISVFILVMSLTGCAALTSPKEQPVIRDEMGKDVGTLSITAERRVVLVNNGALGRFCAEPSPDVAESITSSLRLAAEAKIKQGGGTDGAASLELAKELATKLSTLFVRSQGVQYLRDAMYSLCQAKMNGAFAPTTTAYPSINDQPYQILHTKIIDNAKALIEKELDQINKRKEAELMVTLKDAKDQAEKAVVASKNSIDQISQSVQDARNATSQAQNAAAFSKSVAGSVSLELLKLQQEVEALKKAESLRK